MTNYYNYYIVIFLFSIFVSEIYLLNGTENNFK